MSAELSVNPAPTTTPTGAARAGTEPTYLSTARGKLTLAVLAAIGFLDFADASIVNIALPDIRRDLGFSPQDLQWVLSGYLLTYGGFMLLGGRMADLLGRRRVLLAGTALFAASSLLGGLAGDSAVLVGARMAQGLGAALMMPAALSLLTTFFRAGNDRAIAVGVWAGVAGLASAAGVFLGGVLTEGPGWRWVLFVNPPIAAGLLVAVLLLIPAERGSAGLANFDVLGTVLVTSGMLVLVYALVKAPDVGWGSARTIAELAAAVALLIAFVIVESTVRNPLIPLDVFRIPGLGAADVTDLIAIAGFVTMFFFLTLYMQTVLNFSPLQTGSAYLPLTVVVGVFAGIGTRLIGRIGTRPVLVSGLLVTGVGLVVLSRIPVDGSYLSDILPGLLITAAGVGFAFVAITTAGNAGVPAERAGLAAALLNSAQQVGGALGLAVLTAIATSRTRHQLHGGIAPAQAYTEGFQRALLVGGLFLFASTLIALRVRNSRGEHDVLPVAGATQPVEVG